MSRGWSRRLPDSWPVPLPSPQSPHSFTCGSRARGLFSDLGVCCDVSQQRASPATPILTFALWPALTFLQRMCSYSSWAAGLVRSQKAFLLPYCAVGVSVCFGRLWRPRRRLLVLIVPRGPHRHLTAFAECVLPFTQPSVHSFN